MSEGTFHDITALNDLFLNFSVFRGYTMDVICSTGFGIEVDSQRNPDNPFIKYAKEFLEVEVAGNPIFLFSCKCSFFVYLCFVIL